MYNFLKGDSDYYIPQIVTSLSTQRILTSELIEGVFKKKNTFFVFFVLFKNKKGLD